MNSSLPRRHFTLLGLGAAWLAGQESKPKNKPAFRQSEVVSRIKNIIVEVLDVSYSKLTDNASFADLGADSLDEVEMVVDYEDAFQIEIPDEDAEKIKTVGDAIRYVTAALTKEQRLIAP